jgi:hypothetical protein
MADAVIPIVQRAYDFAVALYGYVNRFPRMHKPLLGREFMGLALWLLVTLVTANRRRDKAPELEEASGTVDALRITLRLLQSPTAAGAAASARSAAKATESAKA